jgi:hypothetical protein
MLHLSVDDPEVEHIECSICLEPPYEKETWYVPECSIKHMLHIGCAK